MSAELAAANATEGAKQAEWAALKAEQRRRAVLIGEQERTIAKLTARCQQFELKTRLLTGKQEETARMAAQALSAVGGQESANGAAVKRAANLGIKLREQEAALRFVEEQLELRERDGPAPGARPPAAPTGAG